MDIQSLKQSIESGEQIHQLLIFVWNDNTFVANQYALNIALNNGMIPNYVESIEDLTASLDSMFADESFKILHIDKLSVGDKSFRRLRDAIIITNKIEKDVEKLLEDYVVVVPKLETWQIEEYALTKAKGVRESDLFELVKACDNDIYKVDNELAKLSVFNEPNRQFAFQLLTESGSFPTTEKYTIFSLSNALLTKNREEVERVLAHIEEIDINPLGLLSVMYKNIANVIAVQLNPYASADTLGISNGQFYAIKKNNINYYSSEQLRDILKFLTSLDLKIKTGEISMELVIPYMTTYMLEV